MFLLGNWYYKIDKARHHPTISHFSIYKMEVCWLNCSQYPTCVTYWNTMDLPFQMDLDVHPGISLVPPRLRLLTQEPFPSDPKFYSIVVLFEKGCSSTIL